MDEEHRALRDEVAELRARLSAIESQLADDAETTAPGHVADTTTAADPGTPPQTASTPDAPRTTDRRSALKLAGAAAAGLAGGAIVATASPAAAANGDNLVLGTVNTATSLTNLEGGFRATRPGPNAAITGQGLANGIGVFGSALEGGRAAVVGHTAVDTTGLQFLGSPASGPSIQFNGGALAPPTSGTWSAGDVIGSPTGMWFCYVGGVGTASRWAKISSALVTLPVPVRVYDSRVGQPPLAVGPKTPLVAATTRTIDCKANSSSVPIGVSSVLLNVVSTNNPASGYLAVYKNAVPYPNTSSLNWTAGQTTAVTTVSSVDGQSRVAIWSASATDVIVDVIGFYP